MLAQKGVWRNLLLLKSSRATTLRDLLAIAVDKARDCARVPIQSLGGLPDRLPLLVDHAEGDVNLGLGHGLEVLHLKAQHIKGTQSASVSEGEIDNMVDSMSWGLSDCCNSARTHRASQKILNHHAASSEWKL